MASGSRRYDRNDRNLAISSYFRCGYQINGSEIVQSIGQHMSPHSPSGQLLHPVVGVGVKIMVVKMISIEPAKCGEPKADVMFEGEVFRATFKPL